MAAVSLAPAQLLQAPLVHSKAHRVFANGIRRHSAAAAPAVQRRCVALAAGRQPAMQPKKPRGGIRDPLDPHKWRNPDFLSHTADIVITVLSFALILVMLGWWPLAVLYLVIAAPFMILPF